MNGRSFTILLEDCLQRLDKGENLPDLLADFPEQADRLKPLLLVAMASRAFPVPVPSQTAQRLGRNQMLAEMNRLEIKKAFRKKPAIPPASRLIGGLVKAARARGFTRLAYSYRLAMVSLALILSGGFFTLSASASSQPGDLLYNLRMGMERAGFTQFYHDEDTLDPPQPWKFGQTVWALEGIDHGFGEGISDTFPGHAETSITVDRDQQKEESKDLKEAEKEAAQELREMEKETAEAEREAAQELKEEDKEAAQDLKEEEKEAAQGLKEEDKEADQVDEVTDQDQNDEQQEESEDEKEAAQDLKEEEKEAAEIIKESKKLEKEADKIEKERLKDAKKND